MAFARNVAPSWHQAVPGARWFKADLHIHTIDDRPGGRAKLPAGVNGPADAAETIAAYARRFLRLTGMDRELAGVAGRLSKLDDDLAVAEQGLDAIVRTVDGGDDAFRLRRLKYGF